MMVLNICEAFILWVIGSRVYQRARFVRRAMPEWGGIITQVDFAWQTMFNQTFVRYLEEREDENENVERERRYQESVGVLKSVQFRKKPPGGSIQDIEEEDEHDFKYTECTICLSSFEDK